MSMVLEVWQMTWTLEMIDSSSSDKRIRKPLKYRPNELNDDGSSKKVDTQDSFLEHKQDHPTMGTRHASWVHGFSYRLFLGLKFQTYDRQAQRNRASSWTSTLMWVSFVD